ncbi:proline and serine-rich protein 3 [Protopterus annectens]|uniref:proline and serine-rich protein 3 n=1 Tax=Protopterus annectens TaxID=7888 RepID=UPI001CF9C726|nr:proline and serine-rich protein 3 [Protopterus annectens]
MVSRTSSVGTLSEAIFSNLGDPFQEQAFSKSFYHPSPIRKTPNDQRQKALSVVPLNYNQSPQKQQKSPDDVGSPNDTAFLQGSNRLALNHLDSDNSSHFNESWPSTEHSSMPTPDSVLEGRMQSVSTSAKETALENDKNSSSEMSAEESVIGRYIERFRFGQPASRQERESSKVSHQGKNEFWWLHSSPPFSSTPALLLKGSPVLGKKMDMSPVFSPEQLNVHPSELQERNSSSSPPRPAIELLKTGLSSVEEYSDVSQLESLDSEAMQLQEKANKLLQQSEMSLSSSAAVSSEGVGSSPLSSIPSVKEAVRRQYIPNLISPSTGEVNTSQLSTMSLPYYPVHKPHSTIRPEDDILFQWRLRRKMEQARETALPVVSRRKFHSPPSRLPRQGEISSTAAESCKLASKHHDAENLSCAADTVYTVASPMMISKPNEKLNPVSPHLHLMCDVLPCPYKKQSQTLNRLSCDVEQAPETTLIKKVHCKSPNDVASPDHLVPEHDHMGSTRKISTESHSESLKRECQSEREINTLDTGKNQQILTRAKLKTGVEEQMSQSHDQSNAVLLEDLRYTHTEMEEKRTKAFKPPDLLKGSKATHEASRKSGIPDGRTKGLRPQRMSKEQYHLSQHGSNLPKERHSKKSKMNLEEQATDPPQEKRERERRREAPPLSPIHNILGQVVSEALFSPAASPGLPYRRPKRSAITDEAIPIPDPASPTSSNIPQSLEAIAQLLEQAEDSDGTEFENDPLLSLLRQQRDHIKDQLRDVDLRMAELQKD